MDQVAAEVIASLAERGVRSILLKGPSFAAGSIGRQRPARTRTSIY